MKKKIDVPPFTEDEMLKLWREVNDLRAVTNELLAYKLTMQYADGMVGVDDSEEFSKKELTMIYELLFGTLPVFGIKPSNDIKESLDTLKAIRVKLNKMLVKEKE